MVMQTGLAGCPDRKTNIKDSRRQPTLCMRNLEVRDRRLRCRFSRFAKPRGNNSDEGKRRTSIAASRRVDHANGTHGWKMVVRRSLLAERTHCMRHRMDLSITNAKPILSRSRVSLLHTERVFERPLHENAFVEC